VTDQRALLGAAIGVIGAALGLTGVIVDSTTLGAVAGLAALCAGLLAFSIRRRSDRDDGRVRDLEHRVQDLEQHAAPATGTAGGAGPSTSLSGAAGATVGGALGTTPEADLLADPNTGLFSESYFRVALDARISAARRHLRPVAVVILDVVQGLDGGHPSPSDPKLVAESIAATVRDADTACRMDDGRFALVLEDTPENGAIWTVERVRRRLAESAPGQTLWAGVACYPAHAFDSDEILSQTETALAAAREWRQDRIEVATAP